MTFSISLYKWGIKFLKLHPYIRVHFYRAEEIGSIQQLYSFFDIQFHKPRKPYSNWSGNWFFTWFKYDGMKSRQIRLIFLTIDWGEWYTENELDVYDWDETERRYLEERDYQI